MRAGACRRSPSRTACTSRGTWRSTGSAAPRTPLLRELKLRLVEDVAHSSLRIGGKIYPYRARAIATRTCAASSRSPSARPSCAGTRRFGPPRAPRAGAPRRADASRTPSSLDLQKVSFADFVRATALPEKVSEWIRVTLEPEMAIEWDAVAALDGIDEMRLFLDTPAGLRREELPREGRQHGFIERCGEGRLRARRDRGAGDRDRARRRRRRACATCTGRALSRGARRAPSSSRCRSTSCAASSSCRRSRPRSARRSRPRASAPT